MLNNLLLTRIKFAVDIFSTAIPPRVLGAYLYILSNNNITFLRIRLHGKYSILSNDAYRCWWRRRQGKSQIQTLIFLATLYHFEVPQQPLTLHHSENFEYE